jgi:hypothetical protein
VRVETALRPSGRTRLRSSGASLGGGRPFRRPAQGSSTSPLAAPVTPPARGRRVAACSAVPPAPAASRRARALCPGADVGTPASWRRPPAAAPAAAAPPAGWSVGSAPLPPVDRAGMAGPFLLGQGGRRFGWPAPPINRGGRANQPRHPPFRGATHPWLARRSPSPSPGRPTDQGRRGPAAGGGGPPPVAVGPRAPARPAARESLVRRSSQSREGAIDS